MSVTSPGTPAPDFTLRREDGRPLRRDDLSGQTDQLNVYQEVLGELEARGARLYGVSCDSTWAQAAFKDKLGVTIEQLSDWEPKGATCRAFGVYHEGGFPQRALVIIGPDGVVKWSYQAPSPGELPGANLIFDGLDAV
jgi:peroxiredoxin (alkyl hydroperoxide reductase subunit C)